MIEYFVDWLFIHLLFVLAAFITLAVFACSTLLVVCYGMLRRLAVILTFCPEDDGRSPSYNPLEV